MIEKMSRVKRFFLWFSIVTVVVLADTHINIAGFKPNLAFILVYYIAVSKEPAKALPLVAIIGLILDSISSKIIGPNILSKGLVVISTSFIKSGVLIWTPMFSSLLGFVLTVIDGFVVYSSLVVFSTIPSELRYALYVILIQAIINSTVIFSLKIRK